MSRGALLLIHIAPLRDDFVVAGVADPGEEPTETQSAFPGLNEPGYNEIVAKRCDVDQ